MPSNNAHEAAQTIFDAALTMVQAAQEEADAMRRFDGEALREAQNRRADAWINGVGANVKYLLRELNDGAERYRMLTSGDFNPTDVLRTRPADLTRFEGAFSDPTSEDAQRRAAEEWAARLAAQESGAHRVV